MKKAKTETLKDFNKYFKKMIKYSKGNKSKIIIVAILLIFMMIFKIILPILAAKRIVLLTNNKIYQVVILSVIMLGINILLQFLWKVEVIISNGIYYDVAKKLSIDTISNVLKINDFTLKMNHQVN